MMQDDDDDDDDNDDPMILNNRAKNHTSERTIIPWTVIFDNVYCLAAQKLSNLYLSLKCWHDNIQYK